MLLYRLVLQKLFPHIFEMLKLLSNEMNTLVNTFGAKPMRKSMMGTPMMGTPMIGPSNVLVDLATTGIKVTHCVVVSTYLLTYLSNKTQHSVNCREMFISVLTIWFHIFTG